MAGRASVWSDARVIAAVEPFVPIADEVWRLQRGSDADCQFFQRMVNGGELITGNGSWQGVWIAAPSGELLARVNSRSAERVLETIAKGLAAWKSLPNERRWLSPDVDLAPAHRWEYSWPEGGLVLERIARELPTTGDPFDPSEPGARWNRDSVWFSRDEVAQWIPPDAAVGSEIEFDLLCRRLARFHLVDNARGQTLPFAGDDLVSAALNGKVTSREGARVELVLEGATVAESDGFWKLGDNLWRPDGEHPRGVEVQLLGRATYDVSRGVFVEFDLVGVSRWFGRTRYNGRRGEAPHGRLGFHFGLAPTSPRVAPTFVAVYDGDWIQHPAKSRALLPNGATFEVR